MLPVLAWLTGSVWGRRLAVVGIVLVIIAVVLWRVFSAGRSAEKAKQTTRKLKAIKERIRTDDEIRSLPRSERLERLSRWVRK